jgi:hypothetical protein
MSDFVRHDQERGMIRYLVATVAVLGLVFAAAFGFAQSSGSISVQWGDSSPPPPPPPGGVVQKQGGPPPHAPAHGYRSKHQYVYYPACNVYREPARGVYFYMRGDGWAVGASLPAGLTVAGLGASVSLAMDTDKPYEHNDEHVQKYPKEKYQKNQGQGNGKGKGGKK